MSVHGNRRQRSVAPYLLVVICRRATLSTVFPAPQDLKWGICHSTGNGGWEECYSAGRNRRQTTPTAVAFSPPHAERSFRARVPVPRHSHRGASRRSSGPAEEPACPDSTRSQHPGATRKTLDEENHT